MQGGLPCAGKDGSGDKVIMHELAITEGIIKAAVPAAQNAGAKRILKIRLKIGELSGVFPEYIQEYFDKHPKVKQYLDESVKSAKENSYSETLLGRKRYIPEITSSNYMVRQLGERLAMNSPIQVSAADIIKIAMVRIADRMKREGMKSKMILQVHDELNFSVLPEEKAQMEHLVIEEMEKVCQLDVPLIADCGWGSNWLEAH